MWLWNSWESSIRATSVTGSFDWVNFPDVSSDPEFLKIFAPYFSSEIVEGKHGIVFLRGYQTVVDLKKKIENWTWIWQRTVKTPPKLLNLRYKNEKVSPEYSLMHVITFVVSIFFGFTLVHVVRVFPMVSCHSFAFSWLHCWLSFPWVIISSF